MCLMASLASKIFIIFLLTFALFLEVSLAVGWWAICLHAMWLSHLALYLQSSWNGTSNILSPVTDLLMREVMPHGHDTSTVRSFTQVFPSVNSSVSLLNVHQQYEASPVRLKLSNYQLKILSFLGKHLKSINPLTVSTISLAKLPSKILFSYSNNFHLII